MMEKQRPGADVLGRKISSLSSMNRRCFSQLLTLGTGGILAPRTYFSPFSKGNQGIRLSQREHQADMVIAGAGLGGCAAALAALRNGLKVILTEETDWIGGQLTSQGVPPDEHQWIETHGAPPSYREFRNAVRSYYRQHYPLTAEARQRAHLNPGDGSVSRLCHEPRVAWAVLNELLAPYLSNGQLQLFLQCKPVSADIDRESVRAVTVRHIPTDQEMVLQGPYFLDATELGDLLPLTKTGFLTGTESRSDTGELHAPEQGDPDNVQSFTMCFAMDYLPGTDLMIDKPADYDFWSNHIPALTPPWSGKLLDLKYSNPKTLEPRELGFHPGGIPTGDKLNLWNYRRIINKNNFDPGFYQSDITIVNWPQNDFMLGNLIGASEEDFNRYLNQSKQLSLALFYWLQTEAPRPDGSKGWPGLRLRGDVLGSTDGMAKYPYVRESRRIKALFTIKEEHVGAENRLQVSGKKTAADFSDSVGIGYYHIDLHPSNRGNNYIDFPSLPFQIPLGALIPVQTENLLAANKNIGTTHITNGCYRLHPVEWSIGEAAALTVAEAIRKKTTPRSIRNNRQQLEDFQRWIRQQGIETQWPQKG
jgi:hypothetical protein